MIDPSTEEGPPGQPEPVETVQWKSLLDGTDPALLRVRRRWRHLPHGPRCKVCAAPFHGLGGVLTRVIMHGQAITNPTLCTMCFRKLNGHPGGAEVDISMLFAGPGEIVASRELWVAAGLGDASGEARRLDIVGRREPLDVVVVPAAEVGSAT